MSALAKAIWSLILLIGSFYVTVLAIGVVSHTAAKLFLAGWGLVS